MLVWASLEQILSRVKISVHLFHRSTKQHCSLFQSDDDKDSFDLFKRRDNHSHSFANNNNNSYTLCMTPSLIKNGHKSKIHFRDSEMKNSAHITSLVVTLERFTSFLRTNRVQSD